MSEEAERPRRINWPMVIGCCLAGAGIVFLAWHFSLDDSTDFIAVVLAEAGVAVFLAGLLFLLERRFVSAVSGAATAAATTAATDAATKAATTAATDAVQGVSERVDRLEGRVSDGLIRRANDDDVTITAASQEASFDNVVEPMKLALERGATERDLMVLSGDAPNAPLILFTLLGIGVDANGETVPEAVKIEFNASWNPDGGMGIPQVQVEWFEDMSFSTAILKLIQTMQTKGFAVEAKGIQVDRLYQNLIDGLADAVKGRRADEGAWRSIGVLYEILGPDWAVTSQGIEQREHGVVLPAKSFPAPDTPGSMTSFDPAAPEWVAPGWWPLAVSRGMRYRRHFTYGSMRSLF